MCKNTNNLGINVIIASLFLFLLCQLPILRGLDFQNIQLDLQNIQKCSFWGILFGNSGKYAYFCKQLRTAKTVLKAIINLNNIIYEYMGTIITQNGKTLWSDNGAGYTERYAYYAAIVEKRY